MPRFDREHGFELAEFKAVGDGEPTGEFEAIVSVFGNVDLGGDRVVPGAFGKSLARWREKGDPIPVIWNHMWDQPEAHIGVVDPDDAEEGDGGLRVKGRIDLDNPFAAQVFRLLSQRRVKEFSFGYNVKDAKRDKSGVNELLELDVIEVGPTLKGMNPATELLAVKALAAVADQPVSAWAKAASDECIQVAKDLGLLPETKAGARLSKASRGVIEQIAALANDLLAADREGDGEQETKATTVAPPESDSAESKADDPDEDIRSLIKLYKET